MNFHFCFNNKIRRKAWRRQRKNCWLCKKAKRLVLSVAFYSNRNKSHWSEKARRWVIHWQDYRWVCRDCINKAHEIWKMDRQSKFLIEQSLVSGKSLYGYGLDFMST